MPVSNKIQAALKLKNKKQKDLAECLGIAAQGLTDKFTRDTLSAKDLIKITDFLGGVITLSYKPLITLDLSDIEDDKKDTHADTPMDTVPVNTTSTTKTKPRLAARQTEMPMQEVTT